MTGALDPALRHPAIWRGNECAQATPGVPTGFAELDMLLPGSGWPVGALTEIHIERHGIGELKLAMPALAALTRSGLWAAMIAPPYIPYAPALAMQGVNLSRLIHVTPKTAEESLWVCEQALEHCAAVLVWLDRVPERALRRLQHVAERGGAMALMFRPARAVPFTAAALRIHVSKSESRTILRVLKRRGGGMPAPVALDLHEGGLRREIALPLRLRASSPDLQPA